MNQVRIEEDEEEKESRAFSSCSSRENIIYGVHSVTRGGNMVFW